MRIDLDGVARDEAVDQHLAPLADAQGAVGGPMSMGVIYEPTTFTPRQANGFHAADVGRLIRMLKTLYVANPYGFSAQQKAGPLVALVDAPTAAGAEVWEPFARNNQIDRTTAGWAYQISQADVRDVRDADGLFAVVNGRPPDEGVMVELGMAIAWHKPTFLFRNDFRRCTDSEVYPLNLMLFAGLPETGWEAHWYSAVEEIADPGKALARWLNDGASPGAPR